MRRTSNRVNVIQPVSPTYTVALKQQYMLFFCPFCHCQRGSTFIVWHEPVHWREISCLSKGLCHGETPWTGLVSWSDFRSPCCAKPLIAVWIEATLKEDSNYPSSSAHADSTVVPFDLFNKGRLPPFCLYGLSELCWYFFFSFFFIIHPALDSPLKLRPLLFMVRGLH